MMAPGVSSTISSTPVASSSARMLRPSRPMIRPFKSSLGRSTTETVVDVLGGAPLDSVGDDLLRAGAGHLARLGLDALDEVGRIAAGFRFDLPEEELFGFVVRQPCDALQLALPLGGELLGAGDGRLGRLLAIPDRPFFAAQLLVEFVGRGDPLGERARLVGERLFEGRDFLPAGADFALGAGGQLVGFFLGLEERFFFVSESRSASRST